MNERYDRQLEEFQTDLHTAREREQLSYETATLKADVKAQLGELASREADEPFFKSVLDTMIVHLDRRLKVRLNLLPQKRRFVLDSIADIRRRTGDAGCHFDPSVPREAPERAENSVRLDKPIVRGLYVHTIKSADKVTRYCTTKY